MVHEARAGRRVSRGEGKMQHRLQQGLLGPWLCGNNAKADETGLIEHNVMWNTAERAGAGNTIYTISSRGTVFQYNEGYLNKETAGYDGCLYDADLRSPHVIFQRSYSHDNNQGLFWMATDSHDSDVIVRYNISQNDMGRIFSMSYANTAPTCTTIPSTYHRTYRLISLMNTRHMRRPIFLQQHFLQYELDCDLPIS
jgi:hypothetical protein